MRADPQDDDLDDLFAAARNAELYSEAREYGFEARVLARIAKRRDENRSFLFWAWRLMPFFISILICLAVWISFFRPSRAADLIAGARIGSEDAMVVTYLAGD